MMTDGFLYWYEAGWTSEHVAARVLSLEEHGLLLPHPANGRITAVSSDEETAGDEVVTDRVTIVRNAALLTEPTYSFQYWMGVDVGVLCTVDRVTPHSAVQRLYLDGLTVEEQNRVIAAVFDLIKVSPTTYGIVIDRYGASIEDDWDAIVGGADEHVVTRPNLVGLRLATALRHPELADPTSRLGDLVIYDWGRMCPV